ncbi:hypothetical protein [Caenibius sp. WL]|uniref:hypothetical protein n=1 Tax=Caenibius sp. WL TaxID=2872646 RepID=UPI001C997930|nr:hypothetical protein [Caenibius sp. WL]QZP08161.1 hypothetical protein K5X80_16260 [Caenibius sp. WL]
MPTYSLVFSQDECGEAQRIEFDADDPAAALSPALYARSGRAAELWDGNRKLADVIRWGPGFWQIGIRAQSPR